MQIGTEMNCIAITGGCGFIGSNFIRQQLKQYADQSIINIDKLTYAGNLESLSDIENDERYSFRFGDICDREFIESVLESKQVDAVVNFAAESHVDRSILDSGPFIQTNIVGTQVLLDACRKFDVPRYVQVSTDEVYGSLGADGLFTEDTPLAPNSPYSASKTAADLLVRAYCHTFEVPGRHYAMLEQLWSVPVSREVNSIVHFEHHERSTSADVWDR